MKKLFLLCAVVSLAIGVAFAQHDGLKSADTVSANVVRAEVVRAFALAPMPADGITIGPNTVCVTAKHADGRIFYNECNHNLKTTAGIDAMIAQVGSTSAQPAAFTYLALSSDATAPATGDTTLASEINNTNGLGRHVATYAHTGGTVTWTESYTWTCTPGTQASIQKAGMFNASTSGTLGFENTFSPVSLNAGDQLLLTWTITAS